MPSPTIHPWPAVAFDELATALDALDDRHVPDGRLTFLVTMARTELESFVLRATRHLEGPSNPETWSDFLVRERAAIRGPGPVE